MGALTSRTARLTVFFPLSLLRALGSSEVASGFRHRRRKYIPKPKTATNGMPTPSPTPSPTANTFELLPVLAVESEEVLGGTEDTTVTVEVGYFAATAEAMAVVNAMEGFKDVTAATAAEFVPLTVYPTTKAPGFEKTEPWRALCMPAAMRARKSEGAV